MPSAFDTTGALKSTGGADGDTLGDLTPTKGNLAVGNGSAWVALTVGTNDHVLTADSAQTAGVKWAAAGGSGKLVQEVRAKTSSVVTCSTNIPIDNTKPQSTEGTEVLSAAITPTSVSNFLVIEFVGWGSCPTNRIGCVALFQSGSTDAIATTAISLLDGANYVLAAATYIQAPGTSSITISVRVGANSDTVYVNGNSTGNQIHGAAETSVLIIREVAP